MRCYVKSVSAGPRNHHRALHDNVASICDREHVLVANIDATLRVFIFVHLQARMLRSALCLHPAQRHVTYVMRAKQARIRSLKSAPQRRELCTIAELDHLMRAQMQGRCWPNAFHDSNVGGTIKQCLEFVCAIERGFIARCNVWRPQSRASYRQTNPQRLHFLAVDQSLSPLPR